MIWKVAAVIFLTLLPIAASAATGGAQGEIDVEILIGRTEVMHDQTARGLVVLGVMQASGDGEQYLPADSERNQYSRLTDAVVRYNNLRDMACGSRAITDALCMAQRFMPEWFSAGPRPYWSADDLRRMAQDMQNQSAPLWSAVCERATARTGDKSFCAIE
jgi:hypothetical protein